MVDVETILASLYADEINISLAWKRQAVSGRGSGIRRWPNEGSGRAVRLFAGSRNRPWCISGSRVRARTRSGQCLCRGNSRRSLYASQLDGSIEWIWDGGFFASLGGADKAERWSLKTVAE